MSRTTPTPVEWFLVTLLAAGCGARESPVVKAPATDTVLVYTADRATDSVLAPMTVDSSGTLARLYDRLMALGGDRSAVRDRWHEPRRTAVELLPNAHDPAIIDSVVRWAYNQVEFAFLVAMGRDLLVQTRVRPDHDAIATLVGEFRDMEAVESSLGSPTWRGAAADTTVLTYNVTSGEASNAVQFYFVRGRLRIVAAVPYLE